MTQIRGVLTVAIVFTGLNIPIARFHRQNRRGVCARQMYLYRNFDRRGAYSYV